MSCLCGSANEYLYCCGLYIEQNIPAPTAVALMRSRYSAYVQADIGYIQRTMCGNASIGFDTNQAKQWAEQVEWLGLQVINHKVSTDGKNATVTFAARFRDQQGIQFIYETSEFECKNNHWFYTDGTQQPLPSRNEICLCGSGKKFKRCCGK